jgi:hypothetical protein
VTRTCGVDFQLTNRKYLQRSYSHSPDAKAKASANDATEFEKEGTAKPTFNLGSKLAVDTGLKTLREPVPEPALEHAAFGNDTIYAVSTAPGRAGIAIVRISGPSCLDVRFSLPSKLAPPYKRRSIIVSAPRNQLLNLDMLHYDHFPIL